LASRDKSSGFSAWPLLRSATRAQKSPPPICSGQARTRTTAGPLATPRPHLEPGVKQVLESSEAIRCPQLNIRHVVVRIVACRRSPGRSTSSPATTATRAAHAVDSQRGASGLGCSQEFALGNRCWERVGGSCGEGGWAGRCLKGICFRASRTGEARHRLQPIRRPMRQSALTFEASLDRIRFKGPAKPFRAWRHVLAFSGCSKGGSWILRQAYHRRSGWTTQPPAPKRASRYQTTTQTVPTARHSATAPQSLSFTKNKGRPRKIPPRPPLPYAPQRAPLASDALSHHTSHAPCTLSQRRPSETHFFPTDPNQTRERFVHARGSTATHLRALSIDIASLAIFLLAICRVFLNSK
jgi:hypothetical protein